MFLNGDWFGLVCVASVDFSKWRLVWFGWSLSGMNVGLLRQLNCELMPHYTSAL
jgi:hypothetical protein